MSLFKSIKNINQNLRAKLFRRDVEAAFYANKKLMLPFDPEIGAENIELWKSNYPFKIYNSKDDFTSYKEVLSSFNTNEICELADRIINDGFSSEALQLSFNGKIKWNYDYLNNYCWDTDLSWKQNLLETYGKGDIMVPYILSRFYQGIFLGKAYIIKNDSIYSEKFVEIFNSFYDDVPFCSGINWTSAFEASIRLINIIYSFGFFIKSNKLDAATINKFLKLTVKTALFIENNLQTEANLQYELPACYLALIMASALFEKNHYTNKLFMLGRSGLENQIREQFHPSGIYKQQSIYIQSLLAEIFLYADITIKKVNHSFTKEYSEILKNIYLNYISLFRSDNSLPNLGDSLFGRLLPFNCTDAKNSYEHIAALGAYYLKISALKNFAHRPTEEILLTFGVKAVSEYNELLAEVIDRKSIAIEPGGFYFIEHEDLSLFIKCGDINFGSPAHLDTFSFELFYKNQLIICDSGTYNVFKDITDHNDFRKTIAHNTPSVDKLDIADLDGTLKVKEDLTKPKIIEWNSTESETKLIVQHYAYTTLTDPVIFKRYIIFNSADKLLQIKDEFFGGALHQVNNNLHFAPSANIEYIEKNKYGIIKSGVQLELMLNSPSEIFRSSVSDYQYSDCYFNKTQSKMVSMFLQDNLPSFYSINIKLL